MSSGSHLSKELLDLVKSIGESRSKQEEDKIITSEAQTLKLKFLERNLPEKKMRELLIRALYVEMLGHDASFSYIHAVNLTQSKNLLVKRIGYLACSLFIDKNSDLIILMIATIQKDLQSKNHLEVLAALTVLTKLCNSQIVMAVRDAVDMLLQHTHEMIRKKAVIVMAKFHTILPIDQFDIKMKKALCDREPSVMAAALNYFQDAVKLNPSTYKDLVPSFLIILKQVTDHRLPRDFDYHRMPAPWIQTKILEILAHLGADDPTNSQLMYETINSVLKKSDDMGINIGYALVYQCLKTITMISPHQPLIDLASQTISRFLSSESHNLKYIGITGLGSIVKIDPKYTLNYQTLVVDCLESTDDTLKVKTLDLLYKMTNKQNVEAIVDRLLNYLKEAPIEAGSRKDLVQKISSLGERFAPNQNWYVRNMNKLFEIGGDQITVELTNKFIFSISEYERESDSDKFRDNTIKIYLKILKKNPNIPDSLMQVIAWILGEYGGGPNSKDASKVLKVLNLLSQFAHGTFENERTRAAILLAITKLHASLKYAPNEQVEVIMRDYLSSKVLEVQERAFDYQILRQYSVDSSLLFSTPLTEAQVTGENLDFNFGFLDQIVQSQLAEGRLDYDPSKSQLILSGKLDETEGQLKFTPYQQAQYGVTKHSASLTQSNPLYAQAAEQKNEKRDEVNLAVSNIKKVWGAPIVEEKKTEDPVKAIEHQGASQLNFEKNTPQSVKTKEKVETKVDQKKEKVKNALFAGISDAKKESSDDSDDSDKPAKKKPAEVKPNVQAPQMSVMDLLDFDSPAPVQQQVVISQPQTVNLLEDMMGFGQQQQTQPQQQAILQMPPYMAAQITTPQFSQLWQQNTAEKSLMMNIQSLQTAEQYKQALTSLLGFQVVEQIGNEVIAAANQGEILLHCRVQGGGVLAFTIKCRQMGQTMQVEADLPRLNSSGMGLISLF